jgi:hypothetical protein
MMEDFRKTLEEFFKAKIIAMEIVGETPVDFNLELYGNVSSHSGPNSYRLRITYNQPINSEDAFVNPQILLEEVTAVGYVVKRSMELHSKQIFTTTIEIVTSDPHKLIDDLKDHEWKKFNSQFTKQLEDKLD